MGLFNNKNMLSGWKDAAAAEKREGAALRFKAPEESQLWAGVGDRTNEMRDLAKKEADPEFYLRQDLADAQRNVAPVVGQLEAEQMQSSGSLGGQNEESRAISDALAKRISQNYEKSLSAMQRDRRAEGYGARSFKNLTALQQINLNQVQARQRQMEVLSQYNQARSAAKAKAAGAIGSFVGQFFGGGMGGGQQQQRQAPAAQPQQQQGQTYAINYSGNTTGNMA